ncbi:DNA-binding response regulator, OmpR family, contains REC and winged-helix (wHTH) domain [Paenibacillus macquariensis]|uniref:DNA-binding response regulator, OmpR family, contains REC and winged-helix (WHTH) domain n=2 Tax=Paenibacillus macquariensis TaxID=948756 RepID=A0ABY1KCW6_9BACL|nr:DNA-binding response regulator, OmpR family, contains REC and winged-helix (wHTH) domain [Paenibacillus macquariensis]
MMQTILIIEDDPQLRQLLKEHLEKYNYQVHAITEFGTVMEQFQHVKPHLVLLDVNLPKFDGFFWCRQIRTVSTCPILFISARADKMDQVVALQNGADDYITKPFYPEVVLAKIESQLRRAYGDYASASTTITAGELSLKVDTQELSYNGVTAELSFKETTLLSLLMEHANQVVSRVFLLDALWDDHRYVGENTLNVYVTRLRKSLEVMGLEQSIETIRGVGYRLKIGDNT